MKKVVRKILHSGSGTLLAGTAQFVSLSKVDAQAGGGKLAGLFSTTDFAGFMNTVFDFALALGAILAVGQLMYAGYLYMGSDFWGTKEKAKQIFRNVITGILLLLSIYLILKLINPQLLNLKVLNSVQKLPESTFTAPSTPGADTGGCPPGKVLRDPSTGVCI